MYKIKTKGKYGVSIRKFSVNPGENEILMPPGSKIKVTKVHTGNDGVLYIDAEEV